MLKPASSACNLRCRYCFYTDVASRRERPSLGIMSRETMEKILGNIRRSLSPGDTVSFGFQGGEPTLAGLDFYRKFVRQVESWNLKINISWTIQTNGILLDEEWCRFLKEKQFLVGLSLDILPKCHDFARVDPEGRGTYRRVVETLDRLRRHGIEYNVLCTLTNPTARHPDKVWKQVRDLDIPYIQFTPCLDRLDPAVKSPYALTPDRFASFYSQLFRLWAADFARGQYRSVKLFDDLVNLLAFGRVTGCGIDGKCRPQIVVEADGSVYPCDFYCLDAYRAGSLAEQSLEAVCASQALPQFADRPHEAPGLCQTCPYHSLCGGGCKRMQSAVCCAPQDKTCGMQQFLAGAMPLLQKLAARERAARR